MPESKNVLYIAENALSAIQGGGIVTYAVLKDLAPEQLLGFYEYRNITPAPEYAERFIAIGPGRVPPLFQRINRFTRGRAGLQLYRRFAHRYVEEDLKGIAREIAKHNFVPEVVYFAGLSYRFLRLAVRAAERYDIPMVVLHMDDWMTRECEGAGTWGKQWFARISQELTRAAARSLASTTNSPRLADKLTAITGYRHVAANNCCSDLMECGDRSADASGNDVPVITYAGSMNQNLQGETLKVLASAVTELNAEGTRVHLHIYTPWEFAPQANAISVPDAVFYKGQVGREKLADAYRRSDFLTTTVTYRLGHLSLFRHSLSTKLSEYLCAGKPVISMGHWDWHLHEYVQEHGCGFSILMDENFSRAKIKEQLRAILATSPEALARIGRNNRTLFERAHDVAVMANTSRRALGLDTPDLFDGPERRGAIWAGGPEAWVPLTKLQDIARRLVDVFEQNAVDVLGNDPAGYPHIDALLAYCNDIGLEPAIVRATPEMLEAPHQIWEPAGTRWSLAAAQRATDRPLETPMNVFAQVYELRGSTVDSTAVQNVLNQLSVRVREYGAKPMIWMYGSAAVGVEMFAAIEQHAWLSRAVEIGGFVSSPGYCSADLLHGHRWVSVDELPNDSEPIIVVSSETSRYMIQEELSRLGLLENSLTPYGTTARHVVYERDPAGPGQQWVAGFDARDYASAELMARLDAIARAATLTPVAPQVATDASIQKRTAA